MMLTGTYLNADGNVGGANGGTLHSIVLTGGSDAATLTVKQGGSGGATLFVIKAAAGTTVPVPLSPGCAYRGQLYAAFTGTSPVATFLTGI